MKKSLAVLIAIIIMINFSLIIGYANNVDFTYDNTFDGIEIINPDTDTIYSDYLLISIKIKENINCEFSLTTDVEEEKKQSIEVFSVTSSGAVAADASESEDDSQENTLLYGPEKIDKSEEVNFYTVQLEKLVPGKYEIQVNVLDDEAKVTRTITKSFNIKEKSMMPEEEEKEEIFEEDSETEDDGVIQSIIKSIFGK